MVDDVRTGTWVTFMEGAASALQVRRCRLIVLGGPDQGKTVEVESTCIRVGANKGCDLLLSDRLVSGHHLEITLDEGGYRVRDLDSRNGTFIAGHRIFDAYLNPGTVLYVGESRLRFEPLDTSVAVELSARDGYGDLVGGSVAMRALYAKLERIAPTDASVLIHGETGTGKELVAEAIHRHSARANGPFVVVDCGSIPDNLIASELFGHEKGAFTGAHTTHEGAFERANGGTVFLDEVGELPLELQPNLLGVLERRQVRRVGGSRPTPLDIRVVAATNRDLAKEMNRGHFRSDLYYRLAVVRIQVPALRERLDDIPLLAEHFLALLPGAGRPLRSETLEALRKHDFPGNVRELRNLIERATILSEDVGATTPLPSLPGVAAGGGAASAGGSLQVAVDESVPYRLAKQQLVLEFDARYLRKLLKRHAGNVSAAARAAGLDRMTVHKMLQRVGLVSSRSRAAGELGDDED